MEKASILIGVGLFIVFMAPILYIIFNQSAKDKKRLKNLKRIAKEHNLNLSQIEVSNTLLLGLDEKAKKLVIVEPTNEMQFDVVDLTQLDRSQVAKKSLPAANRKKGNDKVIHVSLELVQNHGTDKVTDIVFYDENDNESFDPETKLFIAQKWDKLIRANIA